MKTYIVLFETTDTVISKAIAKITESEITHSATLYNGMMYDASEIRKNFGSYAVDKESERTVQVFELEATDLDFERWLKEHKGMKYDFMGILGWLLVWLFGRGFRIINNKNRVFCFEATSNLITRVTGRRFHANVSGRDLKHALGGTPMFRGSLAHFCRRYAI